MPLIFVAIGFALLGILLMGLAQPMARGDLEPNRTVGLRTSDTLADPAVWYAANAAAGRDLFRVGAATSVAAIVLPIVLGRTAIPVLLVGVIVALLGVAIVGVLRAESLRARAAREPQAPNPPPAG